MRRAGVALFSATLAGFASFGGCSLGLDDSKLVVVAPDASLPLADAALAPDAPLDDAFVPVDAPSFARPDGGVCTMDSQCSSPNACLTGRCDPARHACVYDVCKQPSACKAATCDVANRACAAPVAYGFHASAFKVAGGGVGCGGAPGRCIAAAYPFVFVGTTNGVVAYSVADPSNKSPVPVPVTGLPFLPAAMVVSGGRVYFQGPVLGTGPSYKVPIAWVDAVVDPLASSIHAETALVNYPNPSIAAMYPSGTESVLLVAADAAKFFPGVQVTAPLQDLSTLQPFPNAGIPAAAGPAAASGERMVTYRWDGANAAYAAYFSLETAAGTASAQNAGDQSVVASMGQVYPANAFAHGPDGSLLWSAPSVFMGDAGAPLFRAVRMAWLLADAKASQFDAKTAVDIETYDPGLMWGTPVVGPIAWISRDTALVLAAAAGNLSQTSVQVATRSGTTASLMAGRRYVIPSSTDKVGAASTNGTGYVLAVEGADSATVHVFAPGCM